MGAIITNSARADVAFDRGMTFKWGVRWKRSTDGGRTFAPVDLSAYETRFQLTALDGTVWLDKPCEISAADGVAVCRLDPADTGGDEWRVRRSGAWRCLARQPDGEALTTTWNPEEDGADGSLLRRAAAVEQGESTIIGWGYWRAA